MRQLLLFLLVFSLVLGSCSSEDEVLELNGTKWVRYSPDKEEFLRFFQDTVFYSSYTYELGRDSTCVAPYTITNNKARIEFYSYKIAEAIVIGKKLKFISGYDNEAPIYNKE